MELIESSIEIDSSRATTLVYMKNKCVWRLMLKVRPVPWRLKRRMFTHRTLVYEAS